MYNRRFNKRNAANVHVIIKNSLRKRNHSQPLTQINIEDKEKTKAYNCFKRKRFGCIFILGSLYVREKKTSFSSFMNTINRLRWFMRQILAAVNDRYKFDNDGMLFLCILSF